MPQHEFLLQQWKSLAGNSAAAQKTYSDLTRRYSEPHRFYHDEEHIAALLRLIKQYEHYLEDSNTIGWAVWYHDSIYDVRRADNEEQSALLARRSMTEMQTGAALIERVAELILATKNHALRDSSDSDGAFFLDFDLAILGAENKTYDRYREQIRQEYGIYPGAVYIPGRMRVLEHLLAKPRIYLTELFFKNFEWAARENLQRELNFLQEKKNAM